MARSTKRSNQRPDTLMQDRISPNSKKSSCNALPDHTYPPTRRSPLATHGRTIHLGQEQTSPVYLAMSALPPKADIERHDWHVRFVPCVDGSGLARLFFTFAGWSVQPCVRPVRAAHKAA